MQCAWATGPHLAESSPRSKLMTPSQLPHAKGSKAHEARGFCLALQGERRLPTGLRGRTLVGLQSVTSAGSRLVPSDPFDEEDEGACRWCARLREAQRASDDAPVTAPKPTRTVRVVAAARAVIVVAATVTIVAATIWRL
jgi:hypothetical protein